MSTFAFATGVQVLFTFTTVSTSMSGMPELPSRMSLLMRLVRDGYGPMVSVGETAQAADAATGVVVVVVVIDDALTVLGLVGVSPPQAAATPAAPTALSMPNASRLVNRVLSPFCIGRPVQPACLSRLRAWRARTIVVRRLFRAECRVTRTQAAAACKIDIISPRAPP